MAGIQRHLDGKALLPHIQHPETPPGLLRKHNLLADPVHIRLYIAGLMLVRYQNSLRTCRNHRILHAHDKDRDIKLIDHVDIITLVPQNHISDTALFHGLCKCIPCAQILPLSMKAHDLNPAFFFYYSIVKADFRHLLILFQQIAVISKIQQLMGLFQHIAQPEGKHAPIPESSRRNIFFCLNLVWLLLKGGHTADLFPVLRNDIAIFFGRIGRLYPHQHKICLSLSGQSGQLLQGLKI